MAKGDFIVIRGRLDWAKLTGPARPHTGLKKYDKGPFWSVDVTPDAKSRILMEKHGITDKLREPQGKDERVESFISLKVLENRSDGTKNEPPKIVNIRGEKWDGSLIGNGSIADVKVKVVDYGKGSDKGCYLQAVRVLELVPYEAKEFEDLDDDDEFFGREDDDVVAEDSKSTENDDDLDDDVPF